MNNNEQHHYFVTWCLSNVSHHVYILYKNISKLVWSCDVRA